MPYGQTGSTYGNNSLSDPTAIQYERMNNESMLGKVGSWTTGAIGTTMVAGTIAGNVMANTPFSQPGLRWNGIWGGRWAAGTVGSANRAGFGLGARFNPINRTVNSLINNTFVRFLAKDIMDDFSKQGFAAFDNSFMKGVSTVLAGSEKKILDSSGKAIGTNLRKFTKFGNRWTKGIALGITMAAGLGIGISKTVNASKGAYHTAFTTIPDALNNLNDRMGLNNLNKSDIHNVNQLMNNASQSLRQKALSEIHSSAFSPRNMSIGNEAQLQHR